MDSSLVELAWLWYLALPPAIRWYTAGCFVFTTLCLIGLSPWILTSSSPPEALPLAEHVDTHH